MPDDRTGTYQQWTQIGLAARGSASASAFVVGDQLGVGSAAHHRSWYPVRCIAEAQNARGEKVATLLERSDRYAVTAEVAVLNVEALLDGSLVGACTPAGAFGAAHIVRIPGMRLTDLEPGVAI